MASLRKKSNSRYFIACFTDGDGRQVQRSTKSANRNEAMRLALDWEEAYRRKLTEDQCRQVMNDVCERINGRRLVTATVSDYCTDWIKRRENEIEASSLVRYREIVRRWLEFLGPDRAAREMIYIGATDIEQFVKDTAGKTSRSTGNLCLKVLRTMFNRAWKDGIVNDNPARRVDALKIQDRLERRAFTLPELKKILDAASTEWRGLILAGIYTGQRLGDIARLRWSNIDLTTGSLALVTRKTKRPIDLPIPKPLQAWLMEQGSTDAPTAPVFPKAHAAVEKANGSVRELSKQFRELLESVGLADERDHRAKGAGRNGSRETGDLTFHCLRHTATSLLKNAGVSDAIVKDIIGHESSAVSRVYTHIESEAKRAALDRLPDLVSPARAAHKSKKGRR